ncbi:dolichyl-diphosphooligosaccharide--protein glycosyltransferase 48 kDa subunit-like [Penaeus monodon]|uniref:dolichyl-diphosphooligosaccharide--protein glycosyltransferase 48 kDa subunit-like n=1 Tax=Penaeus monodon TaxID=6687 RepID=UPI0018A765D2|nr:dolichyl-diphosphooligosaccharide--protein glycosyltransferase 48 kDa subunit-like [Penaeus monodon]
MESPYRVSLFVPADHACPCVFQQLVPINALEHYRLAALAVLLALTLAQKQNTLVLVDTLATRETHSIFLKSLQERGHEVTVKAADDPSLQLSRFGEYIYQNLVILAPGVEEFGGALSVEAIVEFIDGSGNVLVAGSREAADLIRELVTEVGVEMDEEGAAVIDHLHYDANDDGQVNAMDFSKLFSVKYSLIVMHFFISEDFFFFHLNPIGQNMLLVAALQARNNARVVVSGSLEFFSDAFIMASVQTPQGKFYERSGNGKVVEALSRWVFREEGVLRVVSIEHHLQGDSQPPVAYTIKEDVEYKIMVERLVNGSWKPFMADDVQMDFVRIDPFIRLTMTPSPEGIFSVKFTVPDVYGVYQFKVEYNRVGFTRLYSSTQVSVRPFTHREYERFIECAFPYYASAFSMMFGVWLFSMVFLHHKEPIPKRKAE